MGQCATLLAVNFGGQVGVKQLYVADAVTPLGSCSAVLLSGAEYSTFAASPDFAALGVTASAVTSAFVFGFGAYVLFWHLGYIIRVAKKAVGLA